MKTLPAVVSYIGSHATKALGAMGATVSYLNGVGIIPDKQLKYYVAVVAVLTIWRGFFTANAYQKGVTDGATTPTSAPFLPPNQQIKVTK